MSIFDKNGKVLARWSAPEVTAPGSFAAPHGLALDSKNDLYVSEVTWTFAVSRGPAPADCPNGTIGCRISLSLDREGASHRPYRACTTCAEPL